MKKILTDDQIGENLRAVITAMGLTQDEFAEKIGKNKTHISGYIGNTGSRKAKNLLPELITMGVNGLWFLTGEGQMFQEAVQESEGNEDKLRYEKAGRLVFALAEVMGLEFKKNLEPNKDADPGDEMIVRLMKQVDSISHAGPPPELTDEEFERLVRFRRGYYRRDDD